MRTIDADALSAFVGDLRSTLHKEQTTFRAMTELEFNTRDYMLLNFQQTIDNAPTIETDMSEYSDKLWKKAYERGKAEARKTGHWNYASFGNQTLVKCSECEEEFLGKDVSDYKFCPICGCRMIEEAENENSN